MIRVSNKDELYMAQYIQEIVKQCGTARFTYVYDSMNQFYYEVVFDNSEDYIKYNTLLSNYNKKYKEVKRSKISKIIKAIKRYFNGKQL